MRNFGKIKLSNRDYERVVKRYIKFYKEENKCSERCPLDLVYRGAPENPEYINNTWRKLDDCFCHVLPMFPNRQCPCNKMGQDAFKALEKMVKKYGKEFM